MYYLVNIFDVRSTRENPVAPKQVVVSDSQIKDLISETIDTDHYVMVAGVPEYGRDNLVSNDDKVIEE
ncbi:hypothetical protein [Microvirus mar65]|uniref:Uncharacterized protein n=1 Tax=Microvirus mar65 TaxID=2851202 RepID=A0A8F5RC65_9VIRU|nr:hypothetical protein [Microvirus mar65]